MILSTNCFASIQFSTAPSTEVRDEGTKQGDVITFNYTGAGVSAVVTGDTATVTITGGGGGSGTTENTFETIDVPAGTDPVAESATDTLTITETSPLVITGTAGTDTVDITWDTLTVAEGGTGATSLTDGGILLGSGTGAITPLGVAANGQIPIGDGTTDPVLAGITGTANEVTVTDGAGTITLSLPNNAGTDISADLEEEVTEGSLADSTVLEADLKIVDAAADEDILTRETTTGDFEWHTCAEITGSAGLCDGDDATGAGGSMPRGHIWGLTMSNAADTDNDITIAAGEARSEDGDTDITLASAITKRMDAVCAVGDAQGGLNTGTEAASTWYEVHLIKRTDTNVVDVMFTTTANRATLPTSYDKQRRIGWIRNNGVPTILAFTQVEEYITLTTQRNDVDATSTASAAAVTLTAPPNSVARFRAGATSTTSVNTTNATVFSEIVEGDVTPTETTGIASLGVCDVAGADAGHFELRVSATSTIEHDSDGTTYTVDISTYGWIDARGRHSGT